MRTFRIANLLGVVCCIGALAACTAPVHSPDIPAANINWRDLEVALAHKIMQGRSLRAQLTAAPSGRDASDIRQQIASLNREVRTLERALSYAPSPPVSTEPVPPPQRIAGLLPDERVKFEAIDHSQFVIQAEENISNTLKDPLSVQFRRLFLSHYGFEPVLCGELNAKNSYGGYVGFRRFYATRNLEVQSIETPSADSGRLNAMCSDQIRRIAAPEQTSS